MKIVSISADDNIIPEPDVALELGKSMSLSKAKEEEAARRVHETHEHLVTESDEPFSEPINRPTGRRRPSEAERYSNADYGRTTRNPVGVSHILDAQVTKLVLHQRFPDESTGIFTTSIKGTDTVPGVPYEIKGDSEAKADSAIDWCSENKSDYSEEENIDDEEIEWVFTDEEEEKQDDQDDDDDDRSIDIENINDDDEETYDEYVDDDDYMHIDVDEEMKDAEVAVTGKDDNEASDSVKADAKKTEEVKGDNKKPGLPPTNSNLSVSSGFGNQFLNLSSDISLMGTSPTLLNVHVSVIPKQSVPTPSLTLTTETPTSTVPPPPLIISAISPVQKLTTSIPTPPITTVAPSVTTIVPDPLPAIVQRESELEKDVKELKQVDHSLAILASIRSQVPSAINEYLGSSLGDTLQKGLQKHTEELKQELKQQESHKSASEISVSSKSNHPSINGHNARNTLPKSSKSGKSVTIKEPDEEHVLNMSLDTEGNIADEMGNADEHPNGEAVPKNDWFKQPLRPPTLDLESQLNKFSKHDVFSPLKILSVDMLLLVVQHKLLHLDGDVIVDLAVALRMFTRSLIIKKRVEDVQLDVESYQKKLNITKPQKDFPGISANELYTPSFDPLEVIYEDLSNQKRLMRADELYKFSDGTLKKMLERRILRYLERLVGARELEMDYRLMQRTITCVQLVKWVKFSRTKDDTPKVIFKFLKQAQVSLQATVGYLEATRTMLIFSKSMLFLWAEAVATAYYTQNISLIHTRYNKTPYELLRDRKPDLKFLHIFGALCYLTNDNEDLGLVPNQAASTLAKPPLKNDLDLLFQPMFYEYFKPLSVASLTISTTTPPPPPPNTTRASSSTTIDQDAPSSSTSPINETTKTPIQSTNVEEPNNEDK
ncbi:retrovirus-related pol polyprotein from transposon TNT 1-94 [Tanacetum coccineum]